MVKKKKTIMSIVDILDFAHLVKWFGDAIVRKKKKKKTDEL